jgi:hypothetical protein
MDDERLCQMEEFNLEQQGIIIGLECTCQNLKEQHVGCPHWIWQGKAKSYCSNPKLKGSIWDSQGTIEQT